jgi:hypothetical protein
MKEICIPLNNISDREYAEVDVRLPDDGRVLHFRIENLKLEERDKSTNNSLRIQHLQKFIESYNSSWELLQILDAPADSGYIHLLFRERSEN